MNLHTVRNPGRVIWEIYDSPDKLPRIIVRQITITDPKKLTEVRFYETDHDFEDAIRATNETMVYQKLPVNLTLGTCTRIAEWMIKFHPELLSLNSIKKTPVVEQ